MQINGLQHASAASSTNQSVRSQSPSATESATAVNTSTTDELDLSAEAQQVSSAQSSGSPQGVEGIRTEKVAAIRQAIADGSYETPEKLSAALDRMLDTFA